MILGSRARWSRRSGALGLVLVVLAALGAAGCRRRPTTIAPTIANGLSEIAQRGATEMHCARIDQALLVLPGVVQVRGCGERREYVVSGRGRRTQTTPIDAIETRAASEMRCAPERLRVESPAPAVRAVTGCSRQARYDLLCSGPRCEWTMTAHAGAWAGLEHEVPVVPAGPVWRAYSATSGDEDYSSVALPPPPDAPIPPPPSAGEPPPSYAEPVIPPPPS